MTKPQLHRHLTTGIFNQLSKILKKLRLSDFFSDRAAGKFRQVLELCAPEIDFSVLISFFCATKPDYQVQPATVNFRANLFSRPRRKSEASIVIDAGHDSQERPRHGAAPLGRLNSRTLLLAIYGNSSAN